MEKKIKQIVLLDVHAIMHRAYHALPDFASSKGEPTGALYGLAAFVIKIIGDLKPDYIFACFDLPGPTFRKEAFGDYKAGRPKTEDALVAQLVRSRDLLAAFGIPLYEKKGFEADDLLGTLTEKLAKEKNTRIIIASGDMDTLQLVSGDHVVVYTLKKGLNDTIIYNEEAVITRYGFAPKFMTDYKGLSGDPSDNISGVSGIGDKTATELIQKFGTIEEIYNMLKKHPEQFAEKGVKPRTVKLLTEGAEEAAFSKMLATIKRDVPVPFEMPTEHWRDNLDIQKAKDIFTELEFRTLGARLENTLGGRELNGVRPLKEGGQTPFNSLFAAVPPINDGGQFERLMIATWLLHSDISNPTVEDVLRAGNAKNMDEAEKNILKEIKENGLEKVYKDIELPIIPIIKEAEDRGLMIDKKHFEELSKKYHIRLRELQDKIWKEAGTEFNINSPKQLGELLFDKMKLTAKGLKKTPGGARSTRESELEKLRGAHPIIGEILSYREMQKILSNYIDPLPLLADSNGRIHTKLDQTGTATGRMSSSNPNLQNIPAHGEFADEIRAGFVAERGYKLAAFDYAQIEMRVLAWLSKDDNLTAMFKAGQDIHAAVAARVFGVAEKDVTGDMRRKAKVINFGIIYGMGARALSKNLGVSLSEAEDFHARYFETFPKIKSFFDKMKHEARELGYTKTYFGRRRYFPMINSFLPYVRAEAERMAMNAPLQGTATADIIKIAMRETDAMLQDKNLKSKARLLLQVHDELLYEIKDDSSLNSTISLIKKTMEEVVPESPVPFAVSASVGSSWGKMEEVG